MDAARVRAARCIAFHGQFLAVRVYRAPIPMLVIAGHAEFGAPDICCIREAGNTRAMYRLLRSDILHIEIITRATPHFSYHSSATLYSPGEGGMPCIPVIPRAGCLACHNGATSRLRWSETLNTESTARWLLYWSIRGCSA